MVGMGAAGWYAFARALGPLQAPPLEWCGGKGHLGRYLAAQWQQPALTVEWDQKLWWVHIETLISLIKAYKHTGNEECLQWFEKVHDYTWQHFKDPENGESPFERFRIFLFSGNLLKKTEILF